jgi:Fur family zinc uptake transcriptional regulator
MFMPKPDAALAEGRQWLTLAETRCSERGGQLTGPRRDVLGLLLAAERPLGAYDLIEQMQALRGPTSPPTVYRALEFFERLGLIHRLDSQKAYVVCRGGATVHHPVFLVCRTCKRATEVDLPQAGSMLEGLAIAHDFRAEQIVQEIEGQCRACVESTPIAP